jgi:hypothetical protein
MPLLPVQKSENKLSSMTTSNSNLDRHDPRLSMSRRFRRLLVRIRVSRVTVPFLLLMFYAIIMVGLSQVADQWIVALATTPLVFALLLTIGCLAAYRHDFYA